MAGSQRQAACVSGLSPPSSPGTPHAVEGDQTGDRSTGASLRLRDVLAAHEVEDGRQVNYVAPEVEPLLGEQDAELALLLSQLLLHLIVGHGLVPR